MNGTARIDVDSEQCRPCKADKFPPVLRVNERTQQQ